MDKAFFAEQELAKRGIGPDWSYTEADSSPADEEEDLFLYEYTDKEHSDDATPSGKKRRTGTHAKDALRQQWEREFIQKYQQYMRPEQPLSKYAEQYLLEDLFVLLRNLNKKWVELKAARYRRLFFSVDEEIPLQIGCAFAYEKLMEDKQNGTYLEHALPHYLRVAQNKAIDLYFRKEFGRLPKKKHTENDSPVPHQPTSRKVPQVLSLEGMQTTAEGQYHPDRDPALSYDPYANMERPRWERDERSHRLAVLYLHKLMDYPYEPQKPLAVMYGSCLFQLSKMMDNEDPLTQIAKASTALSSKEWAFMKMGPRTLKELGDESEHIVSEYYDPDLSWGEPFVEHMAERTDDGSGFKWADIVYTSTYTKDQTSNWIESVSKSAIIKAAREIADQADMIEYVMETLGEKNRFRKALESAAKEERK